MQNVAVQRGVNVAVSTTIGGEKLSDSVKANAIGGLVDFGAGLAAQKIGEAYHGDAEQMALSQESESEQTSHIDYVTHKFAHGVLGATTGGILGGSKGAIAGATGAIVAEVVAEGMKSGAQKEAFKNVIKEEARLGRPLTQAEFEHAFHSGLTDQFSYIEDMTKLSAASIALVSGMNVNTSVYAASNAVENNFLFLGVFAPEIVAASGLAITVGKISWEIYALTHEEELAQTREEVCQYVGEKLDVEADTVGLVYDGIMMGMSVASAAKQGVKTLLKKFGKEAVHTGASAVKSGAGSNNPHPAPTENKVVDLSPRVDNSVAKDIDLRAKGSNLHESSNKLLSGEGQVGTYKELKMLAKPGDDLSAHHMPSAGFMEHHGVNRSKGISMMVEEPRPGIGGRHRQTRTYGRPPKLDETPREALARDIRDMRLIYREEGVYTPEIHNGLKEVIGKNKEKFPNLFGGKNGTE